MNTASVDEADPPGDNVTLVVLRVAPEPPETLVVRDTVPLKPLRLVRVIVELPDEPAGNVRELGPADTLKSGAATTLTAIDTEWTSPALEPDTVTA